MREVALEVSLSAWPMELIKARLPDGGYAQTKKQMRKDALDIMAADLQARY
jgi:hypothetical protein